MGNSNKNIQVEMTRLATKLIFGLVIFQLIQSFGCMKPDPEGRKDANGITNEKDLIKHLRGLKYKAGSTTGSHTIYEADGRPMVSVQKGVSAKGTISSILDTAYGLSSNGQTPNAKS